MIISPEVKWKSFFLSSETFSALSKQRCEAAISPPRLSLSLDAWVRVTPEEVQTLCVRLTTSRTLLLLLQDQSTAPRLLPVYIWSASADRCSRMATQSSTHTRTFKGRRRGVRVDTIQTHADKRWQRRHQSEKKKTKRFWSTMDSSMCILPTGSSKPICHISETVKAERWRVTAPQHGACFQQKYPLILSVRNDGVLDLWLWHITLNGLPCVAIVSVSSHMHIYTHTKTHTVH